MIKHRRKNVYINQQNRLFGKTVPFPLFSLVEKDTAPCLNKMINSPIRNPFWSITVFQKYM